MMQTELRRVSTPLGDIDYTLERKAVKRVNLRIRKDGSVYVSANSSVPAERIDAVVITRVGLIRDAQEQYRLVKQRAAQPAAYVDGDTLTLMGRQVRLQVTQAAKEGARLEGDELFVAVKDAGDAARREQVVQTFLRAKCYEVFTESIRRQLPLLARWGVQEPVMRVRNTRSRWGSCSKERGLIHLSLQLICAPASCIDYVVLHELCHFVHFNHSPDFRALMTSLMPDWQERKCVLNCINHSR